MGSIPGVRACAYVCVQYIYVGCIYIAKYTLLFFCTEVLYVLTEAFLFSEVCTYLFSHFPGVTES